MPDRRAAFEHQAVAAVQRTESGNDVGQHGHPVPRWVSVHRRAPLAECSAPDWSLARHGQQFIDGSRPAHAPPPIPPDRGLVASGFEVEVRGDGFDRRQCTRGGFNAKPSASEPSRRSATAQPNRRAYSIRMSACSSGVAAAKIPPTPQAHRQAADAVRCPGRRDGEQPSLPASHRTMGRGSDSHTFAPSRDPDDTAPSAKGQGAQSGLQVSTRRKSHRQPALTRRRAMHAAGFRTGSSGSMAAGEHCSAR